jgi:uncharacterized protein (TIGR04255 family)
MSQAPLDVLTLPDVPRVELRDPPLVLALCQVQYEAISNLEDALRIAPFQQAIQAEYPHSTIAPRSINVQVNAAGMQQQVGSFQWVFRDNDDIWRLSLANDALTLETRRYDEFPQLLRRLRMALDALRTHLHPEATKRIGLRYVNEIRETGADWSNVIRPQLLGPLGEPALARYATHTIQEMRLAYPDGHSINLRHGRLPSGTTVQPREGVESPKDPFYLIDLDAFRMCSEQESEPLDPEDICARVDAFHAKIYRFFRWAVSDDYIAGLAVK